MPKNKSYDDRKKVLNQMFRTRSFTLEELIDRVGDKIGKSISKKTIQNDIRAIKSEAIERNAELKCVDGRYFYEPKNFNLFEVKAEPDAIARIKLAIAILRQIPGLDLHEDMKKIYNDLEMRVSEEIEEETEFMQFDTRPRYTGAKYLAELLEAIKGETVISFDYQPFNHDKPIRIIVHPYLLKEYNNRWFLIGLPEHLRQIQEYTFHQYGLERIKSKIIPEKRIDHFRYHKFDAGSLYKNVIGVTIPKDGKVEKVVLQFLPDRAKYIETNPLHSTQTLTKANTYSYELILNKELESIILSFGADIKVISPKSLKEKILSIITAASQTYS